MVEKDAELREADRDRLQAELAEAVRLLMPFANYDYADKELTHLPERVRDAVLMGHGHNSPTYGCCRRAAAFVAKHRTS